jgi:hypothetical protein
MALDARTRSSIYEKLKPVLGDDDANALMSEFPAREHDELITKQFLRAELADLRTELHREVGSLRTEIADRLRRQTVFIVGSLFTAIGTAVGIARALS